MGVTTFWAPVHRALARMAGGSAGFPLNFAPSVDFLGSGMQDHRLPYNKRGSSNAQPGILGWYALVIQGINLVPSTIATANIAALANVVSGTPMTLVSSTGAGITVLSTSAPATFWPTGLVQASGVVIDGLPGVTSFGQNGSFNTAFYSRTLMVGRGVSITGVTSGAGGNFLVKGLDIYGYPVSQLVTVGAGVNTVNTTKTFKAILSVTPQFTDAHNYSVGTADIFGFPINTTYFGDTRIVWNNTVVTASTGFTAADATTPATTTTGDVRGTYALQSASDGTKRLNVMLHPAIGLLNTNPTTGLFGVAQV